MLYFLWRVRPGRTKQILEEVVWKEWSWNWLWLGKCRYSLYGRVKTDAPMVWWETMVCIVRAGMFAYCSPATLWQQTSNMYEHVPVFNGKWWRLSSSAIGIYQGAFIMQSNWRRHGDSISMLNLGRSPSRMPRVVWPWGMRNLSHIPKAHVNICGTSIASWNMKQTARCCFLARMILLKYRT